MPNSASHKVDSGALAQFREQPCGISVHVGFTGGGKAELEGRQARVVDRFEPETDVIILIASVNYRKFMRTRAMQHLLRGRVKEGCLAHILKQMHHKLQFVAAVTVQKVDKGVVEGQRGL